MTAPLPEYTPSPNPNRRAPSDLTGQRFGHLVVIDLHHYTYGNYHWNVQCDCGNKHIANTNSLRSGHIKSCGCLKHDGTKQTTHGHTYTKVYKSWQGMMSRCYTPSSTRFNDWGGRGITVCERWHVFENFLADMGEPPEGTSIDRINNDGNYELGNCKWSTRSEQGQNKRPYNAKYLRTCEICRSDFKAVMPNAKYCSKICRYEAAEHQRQEKRNQP